MWEEKALLQLTLPHQSLSLMEAKAETEAKAIEEQCLLVYSDTFHAQPRPIVQEWHQPHQSVCWLIYVHLTQARIIREMGNSIEKMLNQTGRQASLLHYLDWSYVRGPRSLWKGLPAIPSHSRWPWMAGIKLSNPRSSRPVRSIPPWPLPRLLPSRFPE